VLPLVLRGLESSAQAALAAGIGRETLVLDPGFGFGKAFDENYPLLAHLDALHTLGFPILAGVSRKSFLTRTVAGAVSSSSSAPLLSSRSGAEGSASPTPDPTIVANTAAILAGAHILRVHDVRPARQAAAIADRILAAAAS
jgi:dihydropteroate synthase